MARKREVEVPDLLKGWMFDERGRGRKKGGEGSLYREVCREKRDFVNFEGRNRAASLLCRVCF